MQPIRILQKWLNEHASTEHYLFAYQDLRALFPDLSDEAYKTFLSRASKLGYLERVCRGIYLYKKFMPPGLVLFHIASLLRADKLNYISLETVLSDAGVISQIPMNWISIMSSGRSNIVACGQLGTIEFIHTTQKPAELVHELQYDASCKLWRASVKLALRDMRRTHRNCDLIDEEELDEFI